MDYRKVYCYDLEMCCWEGKPAGEIIEFSLVEIDLGNLKVTREAEYMVKPENDEISDFCIELTGHSRRKIYRQGRPLNDVIETIVNKYGKNKPYVAWGRDAEVLQKECAQKGIELPFENLINFAVYFNMMHASKRKLGQDDAMKMYGVPWEGRAHSGLVDSRNLAGLVLAMRRQQMSLLNVLEKINE